MPKSKKLLILERPDCVGFGTIQPLFEGDHKWVVTSLDSLPENINNYDIIVLNNVNLAIPEVNVSAVRLLEYVDGGGGCFAIHDSTFIRPGFEQFLETLGIQQAYGGYQTQQVNEGILTRVMLVQSDPNALHPSFIVKPDKKNRNLPIVESIKRFNLCDEYWAINTLADVIPLLIAKAGDRIPVIPRLQKPLIVGGIRRVRNGRCGFLILGHFSQTYSNINIQTYIKNSILWIGKQINSSPHDYELFISFSSKNSSEAEDIEDEAKSLGLRCFLSETKLKYGDVWDKKIRNGLLKSKEICVLMTADAIKSEWVTTEWGAAWALGKRITPILIDVSPSNLPKRLQRYQAVRIEKLSKYLKQVKKRSIQDVV